MATPVVRAHRWEQAHTWFLTFCWLSALSVVGSFVTFGQLFAEETYFGSEFSGGAAQGGAVATALGCLPVIALFDCLRRDES